MGARIQSADYLISWRHNLGKSTLDLTWFLSFFRCHILSLPKILKTTIKWMHTILKYMAKPVSLHDFGLTSVQRFINNMVNKRSFKNGICLSLSWNWIFTHEVTHFQVHFIVLFFWISLNATISRNIQNMYHFLALHEV